MSLKVPAALLEQAEQGEVREEDFLACIRESLPYAWEVVRFWPVRPSKQASGSRRIRRRRRASRPRGNCCA